MPRRGSTTIHVSIQEHCFLAFCAECKKFVGASAKLGRIAIATRAHQCEGRIARKLPRDVDPAEDWLRASGAIA